MAAIVILYLLFAYEKNFDRLHTGNDQLYRVVSQKPREGAVSEEATVPYPTARFLRNEYAQVTATQISFDRDRTIKVKDQPPFTEKNIVFGDSLFFTVMDFGNIPGFWVRGHPEKIFGAPNKAVLTESTARRYFGQADPIGKTFRLDNKVDIEVAGIVKDIPPTTHLPANLFISYSTLNKALMGGLGMDNWNFTRSGYCYLRLPDETARRAAENALNSVVQKNAQQERGKKQKLFLQPVTAIHFDARYESSNPGYTVNDQFLKMLLLLSAFITLIACINYINLSTSLAFTRTREVGIRKTIGASRGQLFFHYMSETVLVTLAAAVTGMALAAALLPLVNHILDKSVTAMALLNLRFAAVAVAAILLVSLLSGAYPALVLAGFNPVVSLKKQFILPARSSVLFRKGLVVFQFAVSIALIICTVVIAMQVNYFTEKSLGFDKDAVIEVSLPDSDSTAIESFRAQLQVQPGVKVVSFCLGAPVSDNSFDTRLEAPELPSHEAYTIQVFPCDRNYLEAYGLALVAGRWFLPSEEKNPGTAIVVNEATARTLNYANSADAVGKKIRIGINDMNPTIVGVVRDFHFTSLHTAISAAGLLPFPPFYFAAGIRLKPGNMKSALAAVETAYRNVYASNVYTFSFIDETLARRYEQETREYHLFKAFSAISIFICCIGLWGLIAFVVVRKTKEIGIRKVLGASVTGIVQLLSTDFLKLVAAAIVIASPVAWYFMHRWLQDFAYRVSISWWGVFAAAGAFAVAIALATISFQAIRAAVANPVKSLRTE